MTPPATAPTAPHLRRDPEHRSRLRRAGPAREKPVEREPWWKGTLALLEQREAEARARLEESRADLQRVRVERDRLSAVLAARDATIAEGARRERELLAAIGEREQEALAARAELVAVSQTIALDQGQADALVAERDAARREARDAAARAKEAETRAKEAETRAKEAETRLRAATKSLRSRNAQLVKAESRLEDQESKIAWLRKRSDRLTELQESRYYRFIRFFWRLKPGRG